MKQLMMALLAVLITVAVTPAEARQTKHHKHYTTSHHYSRSGACDGFHRCRCGTTQAAHFGLPLNYRGHNLKLAAEWGRAFPRTGFHAGAVAVRPHHVMRIVQVTGPSTAIVSDDAGTYQRNVSGFMFVEVSGGGGDYTYSARSHHKHHKHYRQQIADISYQPVDRFGIQ